MDKELIDLKNRIINHGMFWGEHNYPKGFYWDIREVVLQGKWLKIVAQKMWEKIKPHNIQLIFGTGSGATPILSAIQMIASEDGVELQTLIVREQRKDRNRKKIIEGTLPKQKVRAFFVDDMMNDGNTYYKIRQTLMKETNNVDIIGCCTVVDKWSQTGSRRIMIKGTKFETLFSKHDFYTRIDPWIWEGKFESVTSGKRLFTRKIIKKQIWRCMDNNINMQHIKSPVLINENNVYWATDYGKLMCHKLETGEPQWERQQKRIIIGKIINYPTIVGDSLYVNGYDGISLKMNKYTGEIKWQNKVCHTFHSSITPDPNRKQVYTCTENGEQIGYIVCLDSDTGIPKWKYKTNKWIPCTPNVKDNVVVTGTNDNVIHAVDAESGKLLWSAKSGMIRSKLIFFKETVVSFDERGMYRIHNMYTGELIFERCFGKSFHPNLVVDKLNDHIIFTNNTYDGYMFAIDQNGNQKWMVQLRGEQLWSPQLLNNRLLSVSYNGYLSMICASTGEKLACDFLNYKVSSPPAWNQDYLAVNSLTQGLFVYRI